MYATADLKENLSLRIIHSLIPTLVGKLSSEEEVKNLQAFLAHDLIPGANEIFRYGIQAIYDEYNHSYNEQRKYEIQKAIQNKDYQKGLQLSIEGFPLDFTMVPGVGGLFGGEGWAQFAKGLLDLKNQLDTVQRTKSPREAMALTSYLNALDGLAHNTGSFMETLVQQEGAGQSAEELLKLRDITRLPTEQVVALMAQPQFRQYKPFFQEYFKLNPLVTPQVQPPQQEPGFRFEPKKPPSPPRPTGSPA